MSIAEIDPPIDCCFIFDRSLSPEGENASILEQSAQLLFYTPKETPLKDKLGRVNLAAGFIDFHRTFADSSACIHTVETSNLCWGFLKSEPGVWIVMVLQKTYFISISQFSKNSGRLSYRSDKTADNSLKSFIGGLGISVAKSNESHSKKKSLRTSSANSRRGAVLAKSDDATETRFSPRILSAVLKSLYSRYTLLHGSITSAVHVPNISNSQVIALQRLRKIVRKAKEAKSAVLLATATKTEQRTKQIENLPSKIKELEIAEMASPLIPLRSSLFSSFCSSINDLVFPLHFVQGLSTCKYFSLNRVTYLASQYLIYQMKTTFTSIKHYAFLYDLHLVHNDVPDVFFGTETDSETYNTMNILYHYLHSPYLKNLIHHAQQMSLPFLLNSNGLIYSHPVFHRELCSPSKIPKYTELGNLLIYQESRITIVLIVDKMIDFKVNNRNSVDFCNQITNFLRKDTKQLNSMIVDELDRQSHQHSAPFSSFISANSANASLAHHGFQSPELVSLMPHPKKDITKKPAYIYFSGSNCAIKMVGFSTPKSRKIDNGKLVTISMKDLNLGIKQWQFEGFDAIFNGISEDLVGTYIKIEGTGWIIFRMCGRRLLYTVFGKDSKTESLYNAEKQLINLCQNCFLNIFL